MPDFSTRFICATRDYTTVERAVPAPYLRRSFSLAAQPDAASITICGLGFYELFVNGTRVTKGHMAPYISNPDDILYYDEYNVAEYLRPGENVLGVQLGNGFLNCWGGYVWDFEKSVFRSAPKVALSVSIGCGGEKLEFEADERFVCHASPTVRDDLRVGEEYDARLELPGWDLPGFDASGWTPAIPAETPRGEARICDAEPIVAVTERKPVAIFREGDAFVYDFGQNDAGVTRLSITGTAGQVVTLTHAERMVDGKFDASNLIFARPEYAEMPQYTQRIVYTLKGGEPEVYAPRFCYQGFRYVLVEGITPEQATPELLTYVVMHTELREMGGFTCSDPMLNALQHMTRVSTESNFFYFPTDCPHREKNGWTADASLSAEHALLNLSVERSYREWMRNICKSMNDEGALPGIIPTSGWGFAWGNGPAWDHVLANIPYQLYVYRGDLDTARECADAMLRYVSYLTRRTRPDGLIAIGLGDWCAPHGYPRSPLELTDSVMSFDIATKCAKLFDAMGCAPQRDFCQSVADGFRDAIRRRLIDFSTMTVIGGCQTSQALAIYYGILTPAESAVAFNVLLEQIHAQNDHLDTGVLGARVLFHVLSAHGESDLAYRMITADGFPSYAGWVRGGDTTLAEGFEKDDPKPAFSGSRNHHFWGDISGWFIRCIGGIQLNPNGNDPTELKLAPSFIEDLDSAEAHHTAPSGEIRVAWKRDGDAVKLTVAAPDGMTGRVWLPKHWRFADGQAVAPIKSGEFICVRA